MLFVNLWTLANHIILGWKECQPEQLPIMGWELMVIFLCGETLYFDLLKYFFVPFFLIFWAIVVTVFTHHFLSCNIKQIYLDIHWTWRNEYTFCYLWGHWMVFSLLDGILYLKCVTEALGCKRFRVVITTLWEYELQLSIFFLFHKKWVHRCMFWILRES